MFNHHISRAVTTLALGSTLLFSVSNSAEAAGPAISTGSQIINTILNGKSAPALTLGKNGDFYIDVLTMMFYGPKKNGLWPVGVSLKGLDGKNGVDGKNGSDGSTSKAITGPAGPKGETGATGVAGPKGETGATGPMGPSGANGSIGATGPAGAKGETGLTGAKGDKGETGATGATGAQGIQGIKGDTGAQGATGEKGDKGDTGDTGATGATGATGPQGLQGIKGDTGATGSSGAQGPQGLQGLKGDTGATGATGATGPSDTYSKNISSFTLAGASAESGVITTIPGSQNFHFEIVITGSTTVDGYFGLEVLASSGNVVCDYIVAKSSKLDPVSKMPINGIVITAIGTIATTGSSDIKIKLTDGNSATSSGPMTVSGRVLLIRTETFK